VIGKVLRGTNVARLIWYLYGPGRHEEHTDPHIVAGWREPDEIEPPRRADGSRDFRKLTGLLRQPHAALGSRGLARPVWHCPVRTAPGDKMLSDAEWAQVAADIMHRTGLAPHGQEDEAVRWVAIRHGDDHIHIVAMLARQDGTRPRFWNDYYRLGEACQAAEERYGLARTPPRDSTAARRPTRAETEKAARQGRPEPARVTLRRAVAEAAAGAGTEADFFARLAGSGIEMRFRYSQRSPGQVTGYAVALPGEQARDGGLVWFGGGKLAPDLTLPALRRRWQDASPSARRPVTWAERDAIWKTAADTAAQASEQIRILAAADPAAAHDAAWAAADTLHAAAAVLGSRVVGQAAACYDRAARAPYRRLPVRSRHGDQLRRAGRLISAAAHVGGDPSLGQIALITRLAALADSVSALRDTQGRVAQAAAARTAASHLRSAASTRPTRDPRRRQTAARLAAAAFPARSQPNAGPAVGEPVSVPAGSHHVPVRRSGQPRARNPG